MSERLESERLESMPTPWVAWVFGGWFVLGALLALFPPVYWLLGRPDPHVLGVPLSVFYFFATNIFITAGLMTAYLVERAQGDLED